MELVYNFIRSWILPLKDIDNIVPKKAKVLDLGCGEGVLTSFLAKEEGRDVVGVDLNKKRIRKSDRKNLKFEYGDATKYPIKDVDTVILSDSLHHINQSSHLDLLTKISKNLKKGNLLLIKDVDTSQVIRSNLTRLWDFILYPEDKIYFYNAKELKKIISNLGFNVEVRYVSKTFPGSTTLYICTKR